MTAPIDVMKSIEGTSWSSGASTTVAAWLNTIGTKYPDMAAYCHAALGFYFPWCGCTVAYCMVMAGIRPVFGATDTDKFLWARAWLEWGTPVQAPQRDDVLVFDFGGGDSHVTLFDQDNGNGTWKCFGGNQSHEVTESNFYSSQCIGIRRPPAPDATAPAAQPTASPAPVSSAPWQSGKCSWYSQFNGKYEWVDRGDKPNSNALGVPDNAQGVSFYNHATLGMWFNVKFPNGVTLIAQQTDIGPAPSTGRLIDIAAVIAELAGYSPDDLGLPNVFPTDAICQWQPIDPPVTVASLSPQQQAVKWRDLRTAAVVPAATPAQPAPSAQPSTQSPLDAAIAQLDTVVAQIKEAAMANGTTAAPATPTAVSNAVTLPPMQFSPQQFDALLQKFATASTSAVTQSTPGWVSVLTTVFPQLAGYSSIISYATLVLMQAFNVVGPATGSAATPGGQIMTGLTAALGATGIFAQFNKAIGALLKPPAANAS